MSGVTRGSAEAAVSPPGTTGRQRFRVRVGGTVQGVGFRPYVYRLATELELSGFVRNDGLGVVLEIEGSPAGIEQFFARLPAGAPPLARIDRVWQEELPAAGASDFRIVSSDRSDLLSAPVSPDAATCSQCLAELFDPSNRRYNYPYINCTDCGPRFSIVLGLPYDRPGTTMHPWPMCPRCAAEYRNPSDRRFHAQPTACPACGPHYRLIKEGREPQRGAAAIEQAASLLRAGEILAVKGLGGYHLACDAANSGAVAQLRSRKFRKEKPFALMAANLAVARRLIELSPAGETLLTSAARPILLARARLELSAVAPDNHDLGVMLPYTPLHYLLFAAGAPEVLVMTSANRSSEPISYRDDEALERLDAIADAFLAGERPIARRVDDSVVRCDAAGPTILRRGRGYAPGVAARLPGTRPLLALGADLKNAITLVVNGDAVVSQHIGDLEHFEAYQAFRETVRDLAGMYQIAPETLLVAHDLHPQYRSTAFARDLPAAGLRGVQHHRAHVASVLAERGELERRVIGVAFDGTGFGDDGTIWGGEFFAGSVAGGLNRVAHLRPALLPGGDAAARHPVQAAAGFLAQLDGVPDLAAVPFCFPGRYEQAQSLLKKQVRVFPTTSAGRLFDTVAALLGFTREVTFEGQAAIWLEQLARTAPALRRGTLASFADGEVDFRPLLVQVIEARQRGDSVREIARRFHQELAAGICHAVDQLCDEHACDTVVLSGGVFQNELLVEEIRRALDARLRLWLNREVPPNDGGISLGQAALVAGG